MFPYTVAITYAVALRVLTPFIKINQCHLDEVWICDATDDGDDERWCFPKTDRWSSERVTLSAAGTRTHDHSTLYLQSTFYNVSTIYFLHCVYNLLSTLYLRSSFYMYNIHLQSTFYNALLLTSTAVTHHAAMFKIHFIQTRKTTLNAHFWPPVPPILRTPEADLYIICGDGMGYTLGTITMGRHHSQDI